jgi:hypothetical protein
MRLNLFGNQNVLLAHSQQTSSNNASPSLKSNDEVLFGRKPTLHTSSKARKVRFSWPSPYTSRAGRAIDILRTGRTARLGKRLEEKQADLAKARLEHAKATKRGTPEESARIEAMWKNPAQGDFDDLRKCLGTLISVAKEKGIMDDHTGLKIASAILANDSMEIKPEHRIQIDQLQQDVWDKAHPSKKKK